MSKINVNLGELKHLASMIGKAEHQSDDAVQTLRRQFRSLQASYPGVVPGSIDSYTDRLERELKRYKRELNDARYIVHLTVDRMLEDEQSLKRKASKIKPSPNLDVWNNIQRNFHHSNFEWNGKKVMTKDLLALIGRL
ncbi:hypothetical protein, partial [Aquibacillus kalidii]|uniref:hypothetical protein n=1 Tax=Aquibacillus kalidii TaxID=2762597 RepID=UPI001647799B